jgi:hypothetical protein
MGKMVVVVQVCSLDEATSQDLDTSIVCIFFLGGSTVCICLCHFIGKFKSAVDRINLVRWTVCRTN